MQQQEYQQEQRALDAPGVPETLSLYAPTRVAIDGMALLSGGRGIARSLRQLIPLLSTKSDHIEYVTLTSKEGRHLLGDFGGEVMVVPAMPKSLWELCGLPFYARKAGATFVFSLSECGTLWGPPVLLDVPEDPYIRWEGAPPDSSKERARRAFQRLMMCRSFRRSPLIIANCNTMAAKLRGRFGQNMPNIAIVSLGVDGSLFHPDPGIGDEGPIFHLGSDECRDQSLLVIEAYALARQTCPNLPELAIAGNLGANAARAREASARLGVKEHVQILGRVSDADLRRGYTRASICVQPSKYEGFGLQPLEALACGAPLVVTPEPAVEEVVADAAVVANDASPASIAKVITELWDDRSLRNDLRQRGPARAAEFTWSATAEKVHRLLIGLAASG